MGEGMATSAERGPRRLCPDFIIVLMMERAEELIGLAFFRLERATFVASNLAFSFTCLI
jgi:hypothetical protein